MSFTLKSPPIYTSPLKLLSISIDNLFALKSVAYNFCEILAEPITSNFSPGVVEPIPTFPPATVILYALFSLKNNFLPVAVFNAVSPTLS